MVTSLLNICTAFKNSANKKIKKTSGGGEGGLCVHLIGKCLYCFIYVYLNV